MDDDTQKQLDEIALAVLKQDAQNAALLLTVLEVMSKNEEQREAFIARFAEHSLVQSRGLTARLKDRRTRFRQELSPE